jgi:hypothetical protein
MVRKWITGSLAALALCTSLTMALPVQAGNGDYQGGYVGQYTHFKVY